ncbi:hypothetical protein I4F81_003995 [Pyropia yezoensis]|uniref:Uncharacterized protein n=1 Tax=Pyropia yezoensis TaxID=2788 RepID=A0ACC3BVB4_PYRYE|nr:hypothetical protein I4F81_003995 [Neopyropia yezoensis]
MGWPAAVLPPPPTPPVLSAAGLPLVSLSPLPPPLPPLLPVMPVRHVPSIAAAGDAAYAVSTGAVPTVTPARCRFFAAGACAAGDDCRFIHELPEHLRPPPAPAPGPNVPLVRPRAADYSVPAGGAGLGAGGAGGGGCAPAGGAPAPGVEAPGDGYVDFSAAYAGAFASAVAVPSPPRRQLPLAPHLSSSLPASGLGGFAADLLAVGGGRPAEEGDDVGGVLLRGKLGGGKHGAVGDGKVARRVPPNPWAAATPFAPLLPVGMTGRHVDAPVTGGAPYGPSGGGVAGGGGSGCGSAATDALTARFGAATLGGGGTRGLYTTHAPSDRSAHHRLTAAASAAAEKAGAAARYKAKLKRVPCMHFRYGEGVCPFGVTSCLYAHVDREGVPVAADGREVVVDGEGVATGRRGLSMGDFLVVKTVKGKKRRGAGAGGGAG